MSRHVRLRHPTPAQVAHVLAVQVELVKAPEETIVSQTVSRRWWTVAPRGVAAFRLGKETRREWLPALNGAWPGRERRHDPAVAGPRRRPATA